MAQKINNFFKFTTVVDDNVQYESNWTTEHSLISEVQHNISKEFG